MRKITMTQLALIALMGLTLVSFSACGKKGPPKAPEVQIPKAVSNLSHTVQGDLVILKWNVSEDSSGKLSDPQNFVIYRSKLSISDDKCDTCPVKYQKISVVSGKVDEYKETLESGFSYTYKVAGAGRGVEGEASNAVKFTFE